MSGLESYSVYILIAIFIVAAIHAFSTARDYDDSPSGVDAEAEKPLIIRPTRSKDSGKRP